MIETFETDVAIVGVGAIEYLGVDPAKQPIPVLPAVHYTMGGICADGRTASTLPGLYSAGECSSVGIHGANRLGSNSLTELLVFGRVAGEEAAAYARRTSHGDAAAADALAVAARDEAGERSRRCARRWRRAWKTAAASTAPSRRCAPPATRSPS